MTQRIGATIWKEITSKMNLYVEIHDNYCPRINFCLLNMVDPRTSNTNKKMAKASGLTIVYSRKPGPLSWNEKAESGYDPVSSIQIELTNQGRITDESLDLGTRAVLNVMKAFNMIDGEVEPQPEEHVWGNGMVEDGGVLRADRGGIIQFMKPPGQLVEEGEVVAEIYNPFGDLLEQIETPFNGYVRSYTYPRHQAVNTGDRIAYITHDR